MLCNFPCRSFTVAHLKATFPLVLNLCDALYFLLCGGGSESNTPSAHWHAVQACSWNRSQANRIAHVRTREGHGVAALLQVVTIVLEV